jgi:hypothetical protein
VCPPGALLDVEGVPRVPGGPKHDAAALTFQVGCRRCRAQDRRCSVNELVSGCCVAGLVGDMSTSCSLQLCDCAAAEYLSLNGCWRADCTEHS